ncbi:DUF3560 domain-containing protein [Nocardia sp. XZ_19_369]|uniref:DUF3560 domain-containing protein n=1 Tax=Nocardia sp. XZ_19_369 TaxID=2769487 RepID=UPI00188E477A|nr:DUF3560 domain-containing protein [Nocardia sp. XZ_19_369]
MCIRITHSAEEGTLLQGTERDDGTYEVMVEVKKAVGHWKWARGLGQWCVHCSRDRQPKQYVINYAAKQLREAGFDVEVHIDRTPRATEVAEAARAERQYDRVVALQDKASRKNDRAVAADAAQRRAVESLPPGGEPIKIGHHSERRHRKAIDKAWNAWDRSIHADRDAATAHQRAEAAARTTERRYSPQTVANRIETLEAEQRGDQRLLDGHTRVVSRVDGEVRSADITPAATGEYRERVIARMTQRGQDIAYWQQIRAQQIAEGVTTGFGPEDFTVGDFVRLGGKKWHQVSRVNKKSLSVVNLSIGGIPLHTLAAKLTSHRELTTDHTVRYHEVTAAMTEARAREQFGDLLAELETTDVPPRPKRRGGRTRLDHHRGPAAEHWSWTLDGIEYHARWAHPERWYATPPEPVTSPGAVHVSAQRRQPGRLRGEPVQIPVDRFAITEPIWWPEQVHNRVRAFVEARTYLAAARSA